MKKAMLVYFAPIVRVIVDEDASEDEIIEAAHAKVREQIEEDDVEKIVDDTEMPFQSFDSRVCPVCNRSNTREDYDSPDTMRCCDDCGADYRWEDMEILLDPRDELTPEEIKKRGYNSL